MNQSSEISETETLFADRTGWPAGPWDNELDKYQWIDSATNLDCLIVRGPLGALCGYVGVNETHSLFAVDYNDADNVGYNVHGGLTFSSLCDESPEGHVCHVPEAGRSGNVWWFGFDCAHHRDVIPQMLARYGTSLSSGQETYKDVAYVRSDCAELARELVACMH